MDWIYQAAREYLADHAKKAAMLLKEAGALDFTTAACATEEGLILVIESYDEDGNKLSDEITDKLESIA